MIRIGPSPQNLIQILRKSVQQMFKFIATFSFKKITIEKNCYTEFINEQTCSQGGMRDFSEHLSGFCGANHINHSSQYQLIVLIV